VNNLLWFIGLGLLAGLSMFSVVFRRVRAELMTARARGVPVAVIASHRGHPRGGEGGRGGLRAVLAHGMPTLQAAIVATAATSILVMTLCLIACVVLAVLAR
jgi:hypothetical protein